MKEKCIALLMISIILSLGCNSYKKENLIEKYNISWDSPSKDCSGSMPLGNGNIGLNAWVEENGDLVFYNHRPSSYLRHYVDSKPGYLYEFGHGLSYTTFEYSNLSVPKIIASKESIRISVEVKNTGNRAGDEIVLLFINDKISSVTTPVKELKEFTRIHLEPGQGKEIVFTLPYEALSLFDKDLKKVVEPGEFEVMVGGQLETMIIF